MNASLTALRRGASGQPSMEALSCLQHPPSLKYTKTVRCRNDDLFKQGRWENRTSTSTKYGLRTYSHHIPKLIREGIKDLDVRAKAIKHLQVNTREKLNDTGFGSDSLERMLNTQTTEEKNSHMCLHRSLLGIEGHCQGSEKVTGGKGARSVRHAPRGISMQHT